MNILVIGSGGREHAIIRKLKESPKTEKLWCAPGNGGIAADAECVAINAMDIDGVVDFAKKNAVDLVFVAPDDPLAAGMVDALEKEGIRAFGPRECGHHREQQGVLEKSDEEIRYSDGGLCGVLRPERGRRVRGKARQVPGCH